MDVRKTITDTGYVAVGLGVLGAQQIGTLAHKVRTTADERFGDLDISALRTRLDERVETRREQLGQIGTQIDQVRERLAEQAKLQAKQSAERASAITDELKGRVEPVIERAKSLVGSAA